MICSFQKPNSSSEITPTMTYETTVSRSVGSRLSFIKEMAKATPCGPHPPHTLWAFSTPNHRSHYHLHQASARSAASYRIPLFQDGFLNRSSSGNNMMAITALTSEAIKIGTER